MKERILSGEAKRIALIGATFADVRDTMVEGESGLQAVCGSLITNYNRSIGEISFKGGAIAKFFSGEKPNSLRGPQHTDVWGDEIGSWPYAEAMFDMALLGLRLGNPEAIWTTTPRAIKVIRELLANPQCKVTRGSTYDNRENLAPAFFDSVIAKYEGTTLGRQEIEGELLEDVKGALWKRAWFEYPHFYQDPCMYHDGKSIVTEIPKGIVQTVVAIDPTVSDPELKRNPHKDMDDCGLIVLGLDGNACGHVLADFTGIMAPEVWSKVAVTLYSRFKCSKIVAEINQGGVLVRDVLKGVSPDVNIQLVHASMGKRARAEAPAMLYEQGRMFHHGVFKEMEDEMVTWDSMDPRAKSPGRVDSLTWGLHGLGLCQATGMRTHDRILERR